jgi:phenol 2-monooxygenase
MQFHLNGFTPGDPGVSVKHDDDLTTAGTCPLPDEVDVLIVGCGPAGLTLAAQLAAFPSIRTCIVERKPGPLRLGQADGVACRSMEMFNAFGFVERVLKESYWVNETTFWKPDGNDADKIARGGQVQDTEDGLSEFPHVILNQARIHDFYLDVMRNSPTQLQPHYSQQLVSLRREVLHGSDGTSQEWVSAVLEHAHETRDDARQAGQTQTVRARYVVGCDGARSTVRQSIGQELHGDSANQAWGVMDVLAITDFPDIRLKSLIQSANHGSIVLIPREGGYLARIYVELDKLGENERISGRQLECEDLIAAAQRVFHPYTLDVKEVAWWSAYEIGQRLCDKFDDARADDMSEGSPRIFIAGDACHTHSPKAGQGMNVSMRDSFNLGWKLAAVLQGQCPPELLHTYSAERQKVAKTLIDFDHEWSRMISAKPKTPGDDSTDGVEPAEFQKYFVKHGRYTAGTAIQYEPSLLTGKPSYQHLATGFDIGMRFHSAPVIRLADAKPVHLGHTVAADGRWRLFAFASNEHPAQPSSAIGRLCEFLANSADSPLQKYTPTGTDIDSVFDLRAIFQQEHRALEIESLPSLLLPTKGKHGLKDYEKMVCANTADGHDIFDLRGINRCEGCLVIVRPDQHVAHVLPLNAFADLTTFFAAFMLPVARQDRIGLPPGSTDKADGVGMDQAI